MSLSLKDLSRIVPDREELGKGARIYDEGGLAHLSRFESRIFAEAAGSGGAPYRVQVSLDDPPKARCTCMAARSRPFCKHAAALLVAFAKAPESFAVADAAPDTAGDAKKKAVKVSKVETNDLMSGGVAQVSTLARELALSGVAALGAERAAQIRTLGEGLREAKLRRLSTQLVALSDLVQVAYADHEAFSPTEYTERLVDVVLTARKLEKHLAGEALDDKYVEELIGKTWTKKDRRPLSGLSLVEYSYQSRVSPDGFVIRESRFLELGSGEHYTEKQILPGFLLARTEPKPSRGGAVLTVSAGAFPSFAPVRLDLEPPLTTAPLDQAALTALAARSLSSASAALAAFQERRKDIFAPDTLPVALAAAQVVVQGGRLLVVDAQGAALFLPKEPTIEEALASALKGARLVALLGDVGLDGALPTVFPLAALVALKGGALALRSLGAADVSALRALRKLNAHARPERWIDAARAAGASPAAVALGEIREALADALVVGLGALVPRLTDPLVARLKDLGLAKPAELLAATALKPDPADRLDDLIKLYQVLGIALTRLVGAFPVNLDALIPVPTWESVYLPPPAQVLSPDEVRARGLELNRFEAAYHYARWFKAQTPASVAEQIYPLWANGAVSSLVAETLAQAPALAVQAARRALQVEEGDWHWSRARMVQHTALQVLAAAGTVEAELTLKAFQAKSDEQTFVSLAGQALRVLHQRPALSPEESATLEALKTQLLTAGQAAARQEAAYRLAEGGFKDALPALRASMVDDVSSAVRELSAQSLGRLGDAEVVERLVAQLKARAEAPEAAKQAACALGTLGDVRGLAPLLDAWEEGWQPGILGEAIGHLGPAVLPDLMARLAQNPELTKRAMGATVIAHLPAVEVVRLMWARLDAFAEHPEFLEEADRLLGLAAKNGAVLKSVADKVRALRPTLMDTAKGRLEKAVVKKLLSVGGRERGAIPLPPP